MDCFYSHSHQLQDKRSVKGGYSVLWNVLLLVKGFLYHKFVSVTMETDATHKSCSKR